MAESSTATSAAEAFGWRYALLRREKIEHGIRALGLVRGIYLGSRAFGES